MSGGKFQLHLPGTV